MHILPSSGTWRNGNAALSTAFVWPSQLPQDLGLASVSRVVRGAVLPDLFRPRVFHLDTEMDHRPLFDEHLLYASDFAETEVPNRFLFARKDDEALLQIRAVRVDV